VTCGDRDGGGKGVDRREVRKGVARKNEENCFRGSACTTFYDLGGSACTTFYDLGGVVRALPFTI